MKFNSIEDVIEYPSVKFYPRPYHVSFAVEYNTTPKIPHVSMTFYPFWKPDNPEKGYDQHWHVPFTLRDAMRLHAWLGEYIQHRRTA